MTFLSIPIDVNPTNPKDPKLVKITAMTKEGPEALGYAKLALFQTENQWLTMDMTSTFPYKDPKWEFAKNTYEQMTNLIREMVIY